MQLFPAQCALHVVGFVINVLSPSADTNPPTQTEQIDNRATTACRAHCAGNNCINHHLTTSIISGWTDGQVGPSIDDRLSIYALYFFVGMPVRPGMGVSNRLMISTDPTGRPGPALSA